MNIAEAHRMKALETRVDSLERSNADLLRRVDEMSAVLRTLTERKTLKLKKDAA
jgi:hypothetical protein